MNPAKLTNLRIKRVALVDRGANFDKKTGDGAHVMLYKSAGPSIGSVHVDTAGAPDKKKKPNQKEPDVKKSILSKILGLVRETDVTKREAGAAELEGEIQKAFEEDDKKVHKADDPMCKCDSCMAKRAPISEEVTKRMADFEKVNTELAAKLEKANSTLAAEIEKREANEMREVLKGFKFVGVNMDTDVAIFRKMKATDPAMYDRTIAMMRANEAQLADSAMLKNVGSGMKGTVSGDAWAELEAKAAALVSKSATPLTQAQALEQVMLAPENNALLKRYRENAQ